MTDDDDRLLEVDDLRKYYWEDDAFLDRLLRQDPTSIRAVDGVSFDIREGETLGLVGESGCGKSTTGETLLRLEEPTGGSVRFRGEDVFEFDEQELLQFRRDAQVVFQDPFSALDPRMTAGAIISEPLEVHGIPDTETTVEHPVAVSRIGDRTVPVDVSVYEDASMLRDGKPIDLTVTIGQDHVTATDGGTGTTAGNEEPAGPGQSDELPSVTTTELDDGRTLEVRSQTDHALTVSAVSTESGITVEIRAAGSPSTVRRERAKRLLEQVGLAASQIDRYPHEFSGGQRQRIGIARALALQPDFMVLDEPVSALDVSVQAQILNLLADLQEEFGLTYLFIAHDLSVVRHISDRVAVMYLGQVVEVGPVDEIFEAPEHPYTQALLESVPKPSTEEQERSTGALQGEVPSPRNPPSGCRFRTRCPEVIPPDDLSIDQQTYRAVMNARQQIERRELDLEYLKTRAAGDDDELASDAFVDELESELFEDVLPDPHRTNVRESLTPLLEGQWNVTTERLSAEYESICEQVHPDLGEGDHPVACHLYDDLERE